MPRGPAMAKEIEIKYAVEDLAVVKRKLRAAGATHLGTVEQSDAYFDTPDRRLLAADSGLRLRTTRILRRGAEKIEGGALLTFKGPARRGGRAKVRTERQSHVGAPAVVAEILAACGLGEMVTIVKRRCSWRLGRCRVELDRLPILGCFVEIEGPSAKAIYSAAGRLGLRGEPIKTHYVRLLKDCCRHIGQTCRVVRMDRCDISCRRPGRRGE